MEGGAGALRIARGGHDLAGGGFRPSERQIPLLRILGASRDESREALAAWCDALNPRVPMDGGAFRLLPLIFHRMVELDVDHRVVPLLRDVYRQSFVHNMRLVEAVTPALRALSAHGLRPVFLKGAALVANGSYPSLAARPMADVDVYVDRVSRDDAIAILRGLGWRFENPAVYLPFSRAVAFCAPGGSAKIDLHWHVLNNVRAPTADLALMGDVGYGYGYGYGGGLDIAAVPDPTALLLITLIHGAAPNGEPPVRWVADGLQILGLESNPVDWGRIVAFADAHRTGLVLSRMLEVLSGFAVDAVPLDVIGDLRAIRVEPIERWERRLMDADHSSLVFKVCTGIVAASSAHRTARTPVLLARYLNYWRAVHETSWPLLPLLAADRLRRHLLGR